MMVGIFKDQEPILNNAQCLLIKHTIIASTTKSAWVRYEPSQDAKFVLVIITGHNCALSTKIYSHSLQLDTANITVATAVDY